MAMKRCYYCRDINGAVFPRFTTHDGNVACADCVINGQTVSRSPEEQKMDQLKADLLAEGNPNLPVDYLEDFVEAFAKNIYAYERFQMHVQKTVCRIVHRDLPPEAADAYGDNQKKET